MLEDIKVPWVILGHSERRALLNESDEVSLMTIEKHNRKEQTRKDYAFRHQFIEKPSTIPGCPVTQAQYAWHSSAVHPLRQHQRDFAVLFNFTLTEKTCPGA